jgi:hypothetical protein
MKNSAILLFLLFFSLAALGQPNPKPKRTTKSVKTVAAKLGGESEEL